MSLSRRRGRRAGRRLRLPRRLRLVGPRRARLLVALALGLAVLAFAGWIWLRDSSLVAVEHVTVVGDSGPQAEAIRSALTSAARTMTTLDVQMARLRTAASPFPVVKGLRVSTRFPHGIAIDVIERLPVAVVHGGGQGIAVAGDGTLLRGITPSSSLPVIPVEVPPVGRRLTEPSATAVVSLLAAAPYRLLSRIAGVTRVAGHGLVAQVRAGPSIYLGDRTAARAKWIAASEVLGDPGSAAAAYIDVTDPAHPAAGAGTGGAGTASAAPTGTTSGG